MTDMDRYDNRPVKVLFVGWGYSIHMKRRVQIFIDDPQFDVAVISTHNYQFENAKNVLLTAAKKAAEAEYTRGYGKKPNIIKRIIAYSLNQILPRILKGTTFEEIETNIQDLRILRSTVNEIKPDIIFLQTLLYPCYLVNFLWLSTPIIITFWNGDILWWAQWTGIERWLKKYLVTNGVKKARAITVNSRAAYDRCIAYGKNARDVYLIRYPGVNLNTFKPIPKDYARKILGLTAKKIILWPRGLGSYLNSDILLNAAPRILEKYPDTLFIILSKAGGDEELYRHQKLASDLGVGEHFLWKGQIAYEDMPLYYACSDIMISLSSNDSSPNVMLEAMACGVPVIMSDIPQIREWITDNQNGFLTPPRDTNALIAKVIYVFESPSIIDQMTLMNKKIVEQEMDMNKNSKIIRNLVYTIARQNENRTEN